MANKISNFNNNKKSLAIASKSGDKIALTSKKGRIITVSSILNKPKKTSGGVQVVASNGQVVVLKTKVVGKQVVDSVNKYYSSLLKNSKLKSVSLNNLVRSGSGFARLHNLFYSLFTRGRFSAVGRSAVKVIPISKIKHKVAIKSKVVSKVASKSAIKSGVRFRSKVVSKVAIKSINVQKLRRVLDYIKRRVFKRGLKKKIKIKIKLSKKEKEYFSSWVKKQKLVYRPSLASVLYDITGYRVPKSVTGFSIRPVIIRRKK